VQSAVMAQHANLKPGASSEREPREEMSANHNYRTRVPIHSGNIVTPRMKEIARGVQAGERSRLAEAITLGGYIVSRSIDR